MSRLDRRALFRSGAAAALLAATGMSLEASPTKGGTMRIAVPRDDSLDLIARGAVFDTLTEIGPDGTLQGELSVEWKSDESSRFWTFNLRDGVTFHDGAPLNVADVASMLSELGRSDVIGQHRVQLELKHGNPGLPFLLADPRFVITREGGRVSPLHRAVGTGCYKVDRAHDERHFLGRRVSDHYKAGRAGWADTIEIVVVPDAAVRAEALRDGFVDLAVLPLPSGLTDRSRFRYHPSEQDMTLAVGAQVGMPRLIGLGAPLDNGRIAERWWMI